MRSLKTVADDVESWLDSIQAADNVPLRKIDRGRVIVVDLAASVSTVCADCESRGEVPKDVPVFEKLPSIVSHWDDRGGGSRFNGRDNAVYIEAVRRYIRDVRAFVSSNSK